MLSAIGRDANNHIYPIAWAVVSVESKETWKWFIDLLIEDLGMGVGHVLILISDQYKVMNFYSNDSIPMIHNNITMFVHFNSNDSLKHYNVCTLPFQ